MAELANFSDEYMRCLTQRRRGDVSDPSCGDYCMGGQCSVRDGRGLQWIMSMLPRSITDALGMGGNDSGDDSEGSDDNSDGSNDESDGSDDESGPLASGIVITTI